MNKRQTRLFAILSTAFAALALLVLTVDSHRQFPTLTNAENITPEVTRGMDVWHENNCINCHTLFGEGAYYAPDLTKITQLRGEPYLKAYMKDPSQFYDEQRHRRLMPTQDISDEDIAALIKFLDWVANVDNQGWPPRPILVTGSSLPGMDLSLQQQTDPAARATPPPAAAPVEPGSNPVALGEQVYRTVVPSCTACHSTSPGVTMAGPSLAGIASRAEKIIASDEYEGEATDAEGYIRESIVAPSAYLVPGTMFSGGGVSFMPTTYGETLSPEQLDQLVAYLLSLN